MQTSIKIPAAPEGAAMARDAVSRALGGTAEKRLEDARLLTSEVVTNAVRHAGLSPEDSIGLSVMMSQHRVRIEVSDPGAGFNEEPLEPPLDRGVGGWGLFLVERVSDGWGVIRNHPNIVWFELTL